MSGFSRVVLVGNVGRDPELRTAQSGTTVTSFTLAVNRKRGQEAETSWFRVSCFGKNAENAAEWLHKGNKVLIEGQLSVRDYADRDGVQRTAVEIACDRFQNLTPRDENGGGQRQAAKPSYPSNPYAEPEEEDDVPF